MPTSTDLYVTKNPLMRLFADGEWVPLFVIGFVLKTLGDRWSEQMHRSRRCGQFLGLFAAVAFLLSNLRPQLMGDAGEVLAILIRGLLMYASVTGALQIALVAISQTLAAIFGPLWRWPARMSQEFVASIVRARRQIAARPPTPRVDPEQEEIARQQQAERLREESLRQEQLRSDQQRRDQARLRSELLYEKHARQLASAFPRDRFDQFLQRYLNDQTAPELVEQREGLLKEMIIDSLGTSSSAFPKFASIAELAAFFVARREEIEKLPHSAEVRESYLMQLNRQEDEALRRLLKS